MVRFPETPDPTMAGVCKEALTFVVGDVRRISLVAVMLISRVEPIKTSLVLPNPPRMSR